jgi:hypothetical protein
VQMRACVRVCARVQRVDVIVGAQLRRLCGDRARPGMQHVATQSSAQRSSSYCSRAYNELQHAVLQRSLASCSAASRLQCQPTTLQRRSAGCNAPFECLLIAGDHHRTKRDLCDATLERSRVLCDQALQPILAVRRVHQRRHLPDKAHVALNIPTPARLFSGATESSTISGLFSGSSGAAVACVRMSS